MKYFIFFILIFVTFNSFAQLDDELSAPKEKKEVKTKGIGGKKSKLLKEKDTLVTKIDCWYFDEDYLLRNKATVDTNLTNFQIYKYAYLNSYNPVYLGNIGLPSSSAIFFDENAKISSSQIIQPSVSNNSSDDFLFSRNFLAYMLIPENIKYYNTNKPFTSLYYTSGPKINREQTFKFVHTQNVTNNLNAGIYYNSYKSDGQYVSQSCKGKIFGAFADYISKQYQAHINFINNNLNAQQSGGFIDTLYNSEQKTVPGNLSNASSHNFKRVYYLSHSYSFGKKIFTPVDTTKKDSLVATAYIPKFDIIHTFRADNNSFSYTDSKVVGSYYPAFYNDSTATNDSVYLHCLRNTLILRLNENWNSKVKFGLTGGISHERYKAYNLISFIETRNDTSFTNTYLQGGLYSTANRYFKWNGTAKYCIDGYNKGKFETKGYTNFYLPSKSDTCILNLNGNFKVSRASLFEERYYSNHQQWNNNFKDKVTLTVNGKFSKPSWKLETGVNICMLENYIYFDTIAKPNQSNNTEFVYSAFLNKDFEAGGFSFFNKVTLQYTANQDIIPLPLVSAAVSVVYQRLLVKVLTAQVGLDVFYSSEYYSPKYAPWTNQFYLQNNKKKTGGMPVADAFINLKLKKVIMFFKYQHLHSFFIDELYYPVVDYPMQKPDFRFGIIWQFYD